MSKNLLTHLKTCSLKVQTKKKQNYINNKKRNNKKMEMTHQNVLCRGHELKITATHVNILLILKDVWMQVVVDHLVQKKPRISFK